MGSLALISKGKGVGEEEPETDLSDNDLTSEEYALMISNPKRFTRKKFPTTKNRNWQGSYSSEKPKDENKSTPLRDEGKNKKSKLENTDEDEFGGVEIWSTDSEDEELHLDCEMGKKIHKMILPFLEFKEDEIDADCYKCEFIVSSDETSDAYRIGLEKIEYFIKSKHHKDMLKNLLDENDRLKIKTETESDTSEISVEDEVDYSEFVKTEPKLIKVLISENSVEFARISQNKPKILNAKATVYPKVQTVPNKVFQGQWSEQNLNSGTDFACIHDEKFDYEWYIDSGCSCHMTGRKEELREFRALKDGGNVKYGNNSFGTIKDYGMMSNGDFSIQKVAYVEGLQHNLISVYQWVVGTSLKVSFDDEGSEIIEKETKVVLLKSLLEVSPRSLTNW
ncbi:uncharacterized protein LOC111915062 [Lactuca sativa]|uniref:uncharacterized protein LOC111915062 n=1 Tax=Lactuca sativa TaxID=4236 RepID=UPI000CD961F4|nr:uncharacterized protein LOC111915062 [Lactuca sativa]